MLILDQSRCARWMGDVELWEPFFSETEFKQIGDGSIHAGVGRCESCAAGAQCVDRASRARLSTRVAARSRGLYNLRWQCRRARQLSSNTDSMPNPHVVPARAAQCARARMSQIRLTF